MTNFAEIEEIFRKAGVVIKEGHFVYTSGKHGSVYINKDAIYPHIMEVSRLCRLIAHEFLFDEIQVVLAPAVGGVILSQWVAFHLSMLKDRQVFAVYADKTDDNKGFVIRRGYDKLITGKRVLVVEDILTTGGSVKKVIEAVRAIDGNVVGLGVLCNRGGITPEDVGGVPKLFTLFNVSLKTWEEEECPLCRDGVPVNVDVGKGAEFVIREHVQA